MGYELRTLELAVRLERHNSEGDERDDEALERLREEIRMLVVADPDYERIVVSCP